MNIKDIDNVVNSFKWQKCDFPEKLYPLFDFDDDWYFTRCFYRDCLNREEYQHCKERIPELATKNGLFYQRDKKPADTIEKRQHTFIEKFHSGKFTDDDIKFALRTESRKLLVLKKVFNDGTTRYFTGKKKGTESYNKKMAFAIGDYISKIASSGRETVALTLTCDPANYDNDRFVAWKEYKAECDKVTETLRKKWGALYVGVKESTKKGYPHIHLLMAFPAGTIKGYRNMPNRKRLVFGRLFKFIRDHCKSKVFHLEVIKGKNVKFYMSKYVSKFSDSDFFQIGNKEDDLQSSERKAALCFLATLVTRTRQFYFSHNLNKGHSKCVFPPVGLEKIVDNVSVALKCSTSKRSDTVKLAFRRLRRYLIKRCTNSPCNFSSSVYGLSFNKFLPLSVGSLRDFENAPLVNRAVFDCEARDLTCGGCLDWHFRRWILSQDDDLFNFWYKDVDGVRKKFFDKSQIENDEYFVTMSCKLYNFFKDMIICYKWSFREVYDFVVAGVPLSDERFIAEYVNERYK